MNGQIGKYELLQWASPPGQKLLAWTDVASNIGHKLRALFYSAPEAAWQISGLADLFKTAGLDDLVDFPAVQEGKGRATFNFLALLYVLESIQMHKTEPIEFALPVDARIQQFLQSEQSIGFLNQYQSSDAVQQLDQRFEAEQVARSLRSQDLEQFLSQIDNVCAPQQAEQTAECTEPDSAPKKVNDNAEKHKSETFRCDEYVYKALLEEVQYLTQTIQEQNALLETYSARASTARAAFQGPLEQLQQLLAEMQHAFAEQAQQQARVLANQQLAKAKAQLREDIARHKENTAEHYAKLCEYYHLSKFDLPEQGRCDELLAKIEQCSLAVDLLSTTKQKEWLAQLQLQDATVARMQQQLAVQQRKQAELEHINTVFNNLHDSSVCTIATVSSVVDLCALQHLVINQQQQRLSEVDNLEDQLRDLLKAVRGVVVQDADVQLHDTQYQDEFVLESAQLMLSSNFTAFLTDIGVDHQTYTVQKRDMAFDQFKAYSEKLQQLVNASHLCSQEQAQLQQIMQAQKIDILKNFVALLLRKFKAFHGQLNAKYENVAQLCRDLNVQLLQLPEKYAQKYLGAVEQGKQDVELLSDENVYLQQKVQSQQKQIQEFITQLELAEQTNFEAKRMYQRNKQLNTIIQNQADVIEQLLNGSKINLQQKLDDIQAIKSQLTHIQNAERQPVKFENILLVERSRADKEHSQADQLRAQLAQTKAQLESKEQLLSQIKSDCIALVETFVK